MERHWLITWTSYGNWLPGDARGFVGNVRDIDDNQVNHNIFGTPYDADIAPLEKYVREIMSGPPVTLELGDARTLISQYQETARILKWVLQAASVMFNRTHVVVSVPGVPDPQVILETLKSWATRGLQKIRPLPSNGTYWTAKGSKRKLPNEEALRNGVIYVVKKQPQPLAVCFAPEWKETLEEFERLLDNQGTT